MSLARLFKPAKPPDDWRMLPQGEWLQGKVQGQLDAWLPRLLGDNLLKVGSLSRMLNTEQASMSETFRINRVPDTAIDVLSKTHEMPIQSNSMDLAISALTLDFTRKPHTTIRELHRVMVPDGHLIMVNFNPWSFWGVGKLVAGITGRVPWNASFYSPSRINDWLYLLGFDLIDYEFFAHGPPFSWGKHPKFEALGEYFPKLGGVVMMLLRKNTVQRLPVGPAWQKQGHVGGRLSSPVSKIIHHE